MSLTIKNVFTYLDLFFGYLTSALMRVALYGLTALFTLAAVLFVLVIPFDERLDLNELDNLELLVLSAFALVSIRFFKRSQMEGIALWSRIKSYCFISAFLSILCLAIACLVLMAVIADKREISISDLALSLEITYFLFSVIYVFTLYAFAPLPKISWLSSRGNESSKPDTSESSKNKWTEAPKDDVFYTDSTGSTHTDFMNTGNKQ
ncbi:hypothetical protein [Marinomonas algicola]|uniref:hypothetical protein n=1 Tax=Marinomonas algicola TaxID=2773454 RepID=UPI00174C78E3|nr:hypothetical protein [Marinomonas algicola]